MKDCCYFRAKFNIKESYNLIDEIQNLHQSEYVKFMSNKQQK